MRASVTCETFKARFLTDGRNVVTSATITAGALATTLLLAGASPASVHDLGRDSVDGSEIRYEDHTSWDTPMNHAINTWDALGCVNIEHDAWNTITDLEFDDYTDSSTSTLAFYRTRTGADLINFNNHHFNTMTDSQRKKTALHELGHALRFDHTTTSGSVMRSGIISQTTLGSHDTSDYTNQWC